MEKDLCNREPIKCSPVANINQRPGLLIPILILDSFKRVITEVREAWVVRKQRNKSGLKITFKKELWVWLLVHETK